MISKSARHKSSNKWSVLSRVAAATIAGYALTSILVVVLSMVLSAKRPQAVLGANHLSFLIYAAVVIWVFAARTAKQAWVGLLVAAGVSGIAAWLLATWRTA